VRIFALAFLKMKKIYSKYNFNKALDTIAEYAKETLWPTSCAICNLPGDLICKRCLSKLRFIDPATACKTCFAPFGKYQCTECNEIMLKSMGISSFPIKGIISATILDENSKKIITTYKDEHERRLSQVIATYISSYISPDILALNPAITYIPATSNAKNRRGFDHGLEIASLVAGNLNLECVGLFKRPNASDQRELGRAGRMANMTDKLHVISAANVCELHKTHSAIIVVDDVCTTGSTLFAAGGAIQKAGFANVYGATFGRVLA
jgi:predicted amidophosphoribosyltransferase